MKPVYKIEANDVDVTARIRGRLMSCTLVDEAGVKSDTFEMVLDDRDNAIVLPPAGAELKVWLGYQSTGLEFMGLYVFDNDARLSGPPEQMTLRATAAVLGASETVKKFNNALKEQKSRSFDGQTIGAIVETIASEAGYTARVAADLATKTIGHIDQTDESGLHFLTRLAEQYDAVSKPAGGYLVFAHRGAAKTVSGSTMPLVKLAKEDLTSWEMQLADRFAYKSVIARWQDLDAGERKEETVGEGKPVKTLKGNYPTQAEAIQAAEAEFARSARGTATPTFKMPGRVDLVAEGVVEISGLRAEYNGQWSITKATHSFSDSGFATTIECEQLDEEKK